MSAPIERLNRLSLSKIHQYFADLAPPDRQSLQGIYRGLFVGPGWLTPLWPPTLSITGLGGWWGKDFYAPGEAVNIVLRKGVYQRRFQMYPVEQNSYLDARPGLALRYRSDTPFPWPKIVDELRRIDSDHILGMTLAEIGPLRRLGFPFVLLKREGLDEL